MDVRTYACTYTCVCKCMHGSIYECMHVCMPVCMYMLHMHVSVSARSLARKHAQTHSFPHLLSRTRQLEEEEWARFSEDTKQRIRVNNYRISQQEKLLSTTGAASHAHAHAHTHATPSSLSHTLTHTRTQQIKLFLAIGVTHARAFARTCAHAQSRKHT